MQFNKNIVHSYFLRLWCARVNSPYPFFFLCNCLIHRTPILVLANYIHVVLMISYSGFMPPEYINNRMVTPKNDVFSLGVIIFRLMAGENGYNDYCDSRYSQQFLEKHRPEFLASVRNVRYSFNSFHIMPYYIYFMHT